jgi:hypothetical protein
MDLFDSSLTFSLSLSGHATEIGPISFREH